MDGETLGSQTGTDMETAAVPGAEAFHRGCALLAEGNPAEAADHFLGALQANPGLGEAWANLGIVLGEVGRHRAAEISFRNALTLLPGIAAIHNSFGRLLADLERFPEAEAEYRQALALDPSLGPAHSNLGVLLACLNRDQAAETCFRQALALNPDHAQARFNYSYLLLRQGRWAEAWPLLEARLAPENRLGIHVPDLPFPQWRGEPLAGRSLVVWFEQGLGDEIQFCRYVPLLKARGVSRLTLVCRAPLLPLFQTLSGPDQVVAWSPDLALAPHDFCVLPLSLPALFHTTLADLPATVPYLSVSPERREYWRCRLPADGFRLGLVWRGNSRFENDRHRSLPDLHGLAPLWSLPGLRLICLVPPGPGVTLPTDLPLLDVGPELRDFADTAAVLEQLDLLISVDTAAVHLAGALGLPAWLLLSRFKPDWRWLQGREDSPWYPSLRLFRQETTDDWASVVAAVKGALAARLALGSSEHGQDQA
ncbi:tetratricopeptide repeat protein [Azospira inquinata]|uniref:Tetratricopeptide repeat protein n=1 Tax=Azospira inquinata TaxID=2785627 RepID=A0A975SNP9_9RHOO|nr:tetratricopeptide repeat-containing glycosyltransferase family protein [Azospira inquinata]QWT44963.1 tetratricopeptide repeat protein [Azospira inquinata]QWT49705.1 tetratricopeptide repeat protein [Azospira inquinata]